MDHDQSATEKSPSDVINPSEHKMLKDINEISEKRMERQDTLNEKLLEKMNALETDNKLTNAVLEEICKKLDQKTPEKPNEEPPEVVKTADSENKVDSSESPDNQISRFGKWFILKHTFKNVSNLKTDVYTFSEDQEHFGITWKMCIRRNENHIEFYIECENKTAKGLWSIETDIEVKLLSMGIRIEFDSWGWKMFANWNDLEKKYLIDDSLTFEVSFKIKNTTGIYKDNLRCFDDPECSDVVLIVQDKKFHVLKLYLATHSSYFKAMFLGLFGESKKSVIPLTGIDADDFQKYLEVLYGDDSIDEYTVEGLLMVSDMYDTQIVIKKCQQFLLKESEKALKKKLEMSVKYNLEELKEKYLSEINTIDDIRRMIPEDIDDMDPSLVVALFKKAMLSN